MNLTTKKEIESIKTSLETYFDGIKALDPNKIFQVFHKEARMISINPEGNLAIHEASMWNSMCDNLKKNIQDKSEYKVSTHIEDINLEQNTASIKVDLIIDMPKRIAKFKDFYHMVKIGEKWMIVAKSYYGEHQTKEEM